MKAKNIVGKIYVSPMPIWGVLKHFVEAFKLQFRPLPLTPSPTGEGVRGRGPSLSILYLFWQYRHSSRLGANVGTYTDGASVSFAYAQSLNE